MPRRRSEFDGPGDGAIAAISRALSQSNRINGRGSLVTFMVVLSMIAVLVAVLWYSYPRETQTHDGMTVPVIRAESSPYRSEPEDRGGMNVPHRDSTIFETLREANNQGGERVENLLAEDEEPVSRERLFAGLNTSSSDQPQNLFEEDAGGEPVDLTEKVVAKVEAAPAPAEPEISDETRALVQSVLRKQEEAVKATAKQEGEKLSKIEPAAGPAAAASGSFFVQLASLKSREAADTAWKQAQAKYSSALGNSSYRVQSADVADRGTFYRVQAGPFGKEKADQVCSEIKRQSPGGCLVVGR